MVSILDKVAQAGLVIGILTIFQPYWSWGLKIGFFITLIATLLHIVTSHLMLSDNR